MIKCIAIDDEPLALKKLVTYIKKIPYLELVAQCHSAIEAQRILQDQEGDAIFLDINKNNLCAAVNGCASTCSVGISWNDYLITLTYSKYSKIQLFCSCSRI